MVLFRGSLPMPYTAEISRASPTCFLFLVDVSSSMLEPFGEQPDKSKADGVADAINRLLQNLVIKCTKSEGVRDYFHVGVISYGGRVEQALGGVLAGKTLIPVSTLADNPIRLEQRQRLVSDGAGGLVEQKVKFPVWFEPRAAGRTPMCLALTLARDGLSEFLQRHPACFPPIVMNITDGMATDGDPLPAADLIRELASQDGNVLLFNAHLSDKRAQPIEFPASEAVLPDDFARLLFRMSSRLPLSLVEAARNEGFEAKPESRGFVFNADLVSVIRFLDLGTRVAQPKVGHGQ